eukprot:scaffold217860_cov38-Prasinocladus_malaysianus.AAC.1
MRVVPKTAVTTENEIRHVTLPSLDGSPRRSAGFAAASCDNEISYSYEYERTRESVHNKLASMKHVTQPFEYEYEHS